MTKSSACKEKFLGHKMLNGLLVAGGLVFATAPWAVAQDSSSRLAESCASCHGPGGLSVEPATPVIAGLSKGFLIGAMLAYKYADDLWKAEEVVDRDPELEDIVVLARPSTLKEHIPEHYAVNEIKVLAEYFAEQEFARPKQVTDAEKADAGRVLHKKYCEKCHEDGGSSTADDVGRLAGQWRLYLTNTLADFVSGEREMPKKMAKKMKTLLAKNGDLGIEELTHFYASQQ